MADNNTPTTDPLVDLGDNVNTNIVTNTNDNAIKAFVNKRRGPKCVYCTEEEYDTCIFDEEMQNEYKNDSEEFMAGLDGILSLEAKNRKTRFYLYRKFAHEHLGSACEPIFSCVEIKIKQMFASPTGQFTGFIADKKKRPRSGVDE